MALRSAPVGSSYAQDSDGGSAPYATGMGTMRLNFTKICTHKSVRRSHERKDGDRVVVRTRSQQHGAAGDTACEAERRKSSITAATTWKRLVCAAHETRATRGSLWMVRGRTGDSSHDS